VPLSSPPDEDLKLFMTFTHAGLASPVSAAAAAAAAATVANGHSLCAWQGWEGLPSSGLNVIVLVRKNDQ
jgi:hypothetical protein